MEEKHKEYLNYNFSDNEEFRRYIDGIEPPPPLSKIERYKKKFYRLKVDKDFDVDYEPQSVPQPQQAPRAEQGSATEQPRKAASQSIPFTTKLQLVLFLAFLLAFPFGYINRTFYHIIPIALAFIVGLLKKYGRPRFASWYWRGVFMDDHFNNLVGTVVCGISMSSTISIWIPLFLRAIIFIVEFISLAARKGSKLAQSIDGSTKAIARNKENLLTFKADLEVYIGFYLLLALIMRWVSIMLPLFYWQVMQIRYMVSPYSQIALNKLADQMDSIIAHPNCPFLAKWPLKGLRKLGSFMVKMSQPQPQQAQTQ
eukprot:TRINITY_DN8956_c0_g2_i14.p1 TRINITY_DN8956_c0_g2~~TRINITY_DN8956_c0_g2_i14.p1  ORF type:complete len:312 (-),score=73.76 TRINITY_DN8956_c0_g2_i14:26-961(-)